MTLPPLSDGCLPVGGSPYRASLREIWQRFVDEAPDVGDRALVFKAVEVIVHGLLKAVGPELILLGGSLLTHHPHDVPTAIVVAVPTDIERVLDRMRVGDPALGLLSLEGVAVWKPVSVGIKKLDAVGGMVETVLQRREHLGRWHSLLSLDRDARGSAVTGRRVGYVEVAT